MAELDVQPKSGRPWWLWLLLAIIALALLFFLLRGCDNKADDDTDEAATGMVTDSSGTATSTTTTTDDDDWSSLDRNVGKATYDEISDDDIEVRGNDEYAIYSVDETVLFDTDKNTIKSDAADKLKQIAGSMGKRYNGGRVRIYGYSDAQGSAGYNKELAEQRAEAVQNWLVTNGNITEDNISLHPVGEANPVASNATAEGRAQNRRVEIVARK